MPHKRYAKEAILSRTAEYVGHDEASYRTVVRGKLLPLGYETEPESPTDERRLSPSTVWRWISWLAAMPETLQAAAVLIRRKSPASPLFRQVWAFPSRKCRSQKRSGELGQAARMLLTCRVFSELFPNEMFPYFGIVHGFG